MTVTTAKQALVVENDTNTAVALSKAISALGFSVRAAGTLAEARSLIAERTPDLVLLDVSLPDGDGLELIENGKSRYVVITGNASQEVAVRSLRSRATDFLVKPVCLADLRSAVGRNAHLNVAVNDDEDTASPCTVASVGRPAPMANLDQREDVLLTGESLRAHSLGISLRQIAKSHGNVMMQGEAGVDKLSAAYALHRRMGYRSTLCQIQCATGNALVDGKLHVKYFSRCLTNAFTTNSGTQPITLVLDGIECLSAEHQRELLTYLTPSSVLASTTGSARPRIISIQRDHGEADPQPLQVHDTLALCLGQLRLEVPPLRHRTSDIDPIARKMLFNLNTAHKAKRVLTDEALATLSAQPWPGNVRQLANVIENAYHASAVILDIEKSLACESNLRTDSVSAEPFVGKTFWEMEKELLKATLKHHDADKPATAKTLGISLKTLYNRINAYSISL